MTRNEKLKRIVNDPILWIETFVKIIDKSGKLVPFILNPQQRHLMTNKGKYNIVLKARQLGISVVSMAWMLYLCHTQPDSHCMILSHNNESAIALCEKLKQMYEDLPDCVKLATTINNKNMIRFVNGSMITVCCANAKDHARGSTLKMVHFSEVGLMKPEYFQSQMVAVEQALTADSSIILESTAKGLNHFSEMWFKVVNGEMPLYKPFFFGWVQDKVMFADDYKLARRQYKNIYGSYLTSAELDKEELLLQEKGADLSQLMWRRLKITNNGLEAFHQEFPATPIEAFISSGSNVFDSKKIGERFAEVTTKVQAKALPEKVAPIIKKFARYMTIWKLPALGQKYQIGVDTGCGLSGDHDYSVIEIIDENAEQVLEWRSNSVKPYEFTDLVLEIAKWYNKALLVVEIASAGHTVVDKLVHEYRYINMYRSKVDGGKTRRPGWITDQKTKSDMISDLQEWFETKLCVINSKDLLNEMKLFEMVNGKMQAASGHDDLVMAFAMAIQGYKSKQFYRIAGT